MLRTDWTQCRTGVAHCVQNWLVYQGISVSCLAFWWLWAVVKRVEHLDLSRSKDIMVTCCKEFLWSCVTSAQQYSLLQLLIQAMLLWVQSLLKVLIQILCKDCFWGLIVTFIAVFSFSKSNKVFNFDFSVRNWAFCSYFRVVMTILNSFSQNFIKFFWNIGWSRPHDRVVFTAYNLKVAVVKLGNRRLLCYFNSVIYWLNNLW